MSGDQYWLGLAMIKGLGPIRMKRLIDYFNTPEKIWEADKGQLQQVPGIAYGLARKICEQRKKININKIIEGIDNKNVKYVTLTDKDYPDKLKNIYDPPPVIFYRGKYILNKYTAVAVVGSRRSTSYGRKAAQNISYQLAQKGILVISGMARGIDSSGHKGALKAGGKTIAVLGSGVDVIYPPENKNLNDQIINNGMILSEFPPGAKPLPGNFPRRNRIISGLSVGVVVVEAAARSGSLITADQALEQGKEIFAVPGNIYRSQSKGTNKLIQKGAKLVCSVEDILEEIFLYTNQDNKEQNKHRMEYPDLTLEEKKVIDLFHDSELLHINEIIEKSSKSAAEVNTILLKMELKDIISREAGKKYRFMGLQNLLKPL